MKCSVYVAAAACGAGLSSAACAQPEFHLIGTPTTNTAFRVTDISENGGVVVGLNGTNGVWRWERGLGGYETMPAITVPGGACEVYSAFVSADGTRVVGHGGGAQCLGRVKQVYLWTHGQSPVIGPFNTASQYFTVKGIDATGTVAGGSLEWAGYFQMAKTPVMGGNNYSLPTTPGIYDQSCGMAPDAYATSATGMAPDGTLLGTITDCNNLMSGMIWRGGAVHTRLSQAPIAASWGADIVLSTQLRYVAGGTQAQGLTFAPGSVATDISVDGSIITADMAVGPTSHAGYSINNGAPVHLQTALANAGVSFPSGLILQTATAVSADGRWIAGMAQLGTGGRQAYVAHIPGVCGDLDFNNDGVSPDTMDVDDFLCTMFGGDCCWQAIPSCDSIDINMDGMYPDIADIEAFLRLFSGGSCF